VGGVVGANIDPVQVVQEYFEAQAGSDLDLALSTLDDRVVFDVGRGRYEGKDAVSSFLAMLAAKDTATVVVDMSLAADGRILCVLRNSDRDLRQLGIESLDLAAEVSVEDGRITQFHARPTPESIEKLEAARAAGRSAEGLRLAEEAGTLPPPD
jgi:limonene-1,2-epoxide hydrolase